MLKKILVPVDGSAFGESALTTALELSRRADADIRLAMVNQPAGLMGGWEEAFQSTHTTYVESLEGKVAEGAARPSLARHTRRAALGLAVLTFVSAGWAANLGGRIRHPEIVESLTSGDTVGVTEKEDDDRESGERKPDDGHR